MNSAHLTKATSLHIADRVWESADRFLFPDKSGRRLGKPHAGKWTEFTTIPGRARSHTKDAPVWETYRLAGTLQGHLDDYATAAGMTVAEAAAASPSTSILSQPRHLQAPDKPKKWAGHNGALAVVYTGLPGGDMIIPVRLPQGSGQFQRLAHFLLDPGAWHKIDLVRARDRGHPAAGATRPPDHPRSRLHLPSDPPGPRQCSPPDGLPGGTEHLQPRRRLHPEPGTHGTALTSRLVISPRQKAIADREKSKARRRQWYLDRSRRAANPAQYQGSHGQKEAGRAPGRSRAHTQADPGAPR